MVEQSAPQGAVGADAGVAVLARPRRTNPISYVFTHERLCGYVFIAPWFLGFLVWTLIPFLASIFLSLTNWSLLGKFEFLWFANYQKMFTRDKRFLAALRNTWTYVLVSIPLKQMIALSIAMLLNQKLRGVYIYRTVFYLPSVTAGVATSIVWSMIFGYRMGILNSVLSRIGITPQPWLTSIKWALPTLIFISLWNVGSIFIIYLAGLQGVPTHYYEAAEVDGANDWQKFVKITLPMITPSIFFNIVMGFIGSFKVFTQAYVMTGGGPADRTLFYVLYLYYKAFRDFRMGYAAAMAWILFVIILVLTVFQMWLSRKWVYYEGSTPDRGAA